MKYPNLIALILCGALVVNCTTPASTDKCGEDELMTASETYVKSCRDAGDALVAKANPETGQLPPDSTTASFPLELAKEGSWNFQFCYSVNDYAAEVGFYATVMGLQPCLVGPNCALFLGPDGAFSLQIAEAGEGETISPDAVSIMFRVDNIAEARAEFEERGLVFEDSPGPCMFMTPNGIPVMLWSSKYTQIDPK